MDLATSNAMFPATQEPSDRSTSGVRPTRSARVPPEQAASAAPARPGPALAPQPYQAVRAPGHGRAGTQALRRALETLNGMS